jgi:hypothetical protein
MSPTIKILSNHQDTCYERFLVLDPDRHLVLLHSYPWLDWLKREVNQPDLFLYRHKETGRFVLAKWMVKPSEGRPCCQELESFEGHPNGSWPEDLLHPDVLKERLLPQQEVLRKIKALSAEKKAAERSQRKDMTTAKCEYAKRLRQKGMKREARGIELNQVPYAPKELVPAPLAQHLS